MPLGSRASEIYAALIQQGDSLLQGSATLASSGATTAADAARRGALLFYVASIDSYFHELGLELLMARLNSDDARHKEAARAYLGLNQEKLESGPTEQSVRMKLSFKTLVDPEKIDQLLTACALPSGAIWEFAGERVLKQAKILRAALQIQYERRNKIAHEGDWDHLRFGFRDIDDSGCQSGSSH